MFFFINTTVPYSTLDKKTLYYNFKSCIQYLFNIATMFQDILMTYVMYNFDLGYVQVITNVCGTNSDGQI